MFAMSDDENDGDDPSIDVVAYHEAGHAVVHLYFGHAVEAVTIVRDGAAAGGALVDQQQLDALRYEDQLLTQVVFERYIMGAMAGELAQRRYSAASVDDVHGASDRRCVQDYLDELDAPTQEIREAYWRLLELRTAALLDKLWPQVERLAQALIERKSLTGAEAAHMYTDPEVRGMFTA